LEAGSRDTGRANARGAVNDGEFFALDDLAGLAAGMIRPGPDGIQLEILCPVSESLAPLRCSFKSQCKVVVSVCVGGDEPNCGTVSVDSFGEPLQFVQHVAEVEEGESVVGVRLGGAPVQILGTLEFALVIADGAEVDGGRGVVRVKREDLFVDFDGFAGLPGFLKLHGTKEEVAYVCFALCGGAGGGGRTSVRRLGPSKSKTN
jgi:hypothetical protein